MSIRTAAPALRLGGSLDNAFGRAELSAGRRDRPARLAEGEQ